MMNRRHLLRKSFNSFSHQRCQFSSLPSHTSNTHSHPYHTLLASCKTLNSLIQIHARLILLGYKSDNFTATQLINTYSFFKKCHAARSVFDSILNPTVLIWNSMIRAYTRSNQYKEALNMYNYMLQKSVQPDKYTFTFILKACTGVLDLQVGVVIHNDVANKGLESDVFIATGLVDMYSKIGELTRAREVFNKMPNKDVVAWNAMIAGLSQSSAPWDALELFRSMQFDGGVKPNYVSLLNLFPAVSKLLDIRSCKSINGYVLRRGFPMSVSNGLIDMYSKCGYADTACRIFDQMQDKDDVSWGTIMAGYAHNGCFAEVLELFDEMKDKNVKMNTVSAVSALLAAADMRDLKKGMEIHNTVIQQKIDSDIVVATPIMTMYAKCGELDKVKELFNCLKGKDLVAWSAVIAAFAQSGYPEEAISLFRDMQNKYLKPNRVCLISALPACAELSSLRLGKSMHCFAVKNDMGYDVSTGTALVSMYAKCAFFTYAVVIFDRMPQKEIVTWNALINGYAQIGDAYCAMEMFRELHFSGFLPDSGTMVGALPACALMGDIGQGTCIHGKIIKLGFESDSHVANALIDMYAKCGNVSSAEFLFESTKFAKDKVSWNVMITVYLQSGRAKDAILTFRQMKSEGFQPNVVTIVSILPAAANLVLLKDGMGFHVYIVQMGLESNTLVGNSLIDMYAKCGRLDYAEKFFREMDNKDKITWNVMLSGFAMHGFGICATEMFSLMQESSVEVDSVSFISVLSACRHAGLVDEGRNIFYSMREKHGIEPGLEHYACAVDLLGRAGLFDEAMGLIETMPMKPDAGVWGALLGACRMHSNVKLAEMALNFLVKLEPRNSAHHVVLSNIYAQSDRWSDARSARVKMDQMGLKKTPGCSWVGQKQVEVN